MLEWRKQKVVTLLAANSPYREEEGGGPTRNEEVNKLLTSLSTSTMSSAPRTKSSRLNQSGKVTDPLLKGFQLF